MIDAQERNKQRKILTTITYNDLGIILDVKVEELDSSADLQPTCNQLATDCISRQEAIDVIRFECGEWTGLAKTIENKINELPSAQPEQRWIPVTERLPDDNREVEVTCEIRRVDGKKYRYTCHASYVHRYSIESTDYCNWEDCDEYNKEEDKYYALSGWYERVHNGDDYSYCAIEDFVIAWRELSEPYGGEKE